MKNRKVAASLLLASTLLSAQPIYAGGMPVFDSVQETLMLKEIAESVKQVATLVQMADLAVRGLTIQNAMKAVLGEGPGSAFMDLVGGAQDLYTNSNSLFYNVTNKQAMLTAEIETMLPNMQNMSFVELRAFALRWQNMLREDTLQARALEAEGLRIQSEFRAEAARGLKQSQNVEGVTGAVQALTHVSGAIAGQLDLTNNKLGTIINQGNNELVEKDRMNQTAEQIRKRDREILSQMVASSPGIARLSPLNWGR